jgi:hypothetical protein
MKAALAHNKISIEINPFPLSHLPVIESGLEHVATVLISATGNHMEAPRMILSHLRTDGPGGFLTLEEIECN